MIKLKITRTSDFQRSDGFRFSIANEKPTEPPVSIDWDKKI